MSQKVKLVSRHRNKFSISDDIYFGIVTYSNGV